MEEDKNLTEGQEAEVEVSECVEERTKEVSNEELEAESNAKETSDTETPEERKRRRTIDFWDNVKFFCISFLIIYMVFFIFPPYLVSGDSMNQTLRDKAFGFGIRFVEPDHGDIIVFSNANTRGEDYIKRVIGVPGDTVRIEGDTVYVNGQRLTEEYAYFDPTRAGMYAEMQKEWTLGEDEFFVLGDNRYNSSDSRAIGVVHRDDIKCRMWVFLWGK